MSKQALKIQKSDAKKAKNSSANKIAAKDSELVSKEALAEEFELLDQKSQSLTKLNLGSMGAGTPPTDDDDPDSQKKSIQSKSGLPKKILQGIEKLSGLN